MDIIEVNGRVFPIIWRKKGAKFTDDCPYCKKQHAHGLPEGHRNSHCATMSNMPKKEYSTMIEGKVYCCRKDGYFLKEY